MDKSKLEKEIVMSAAQVAITKDYFDKEVTTDLINKALKESERYTDIRMRECNRKARREEKMIRKSHRIACISVTLAIISFLMLFLCESTIKSSVGISMSVIIMEVVGIILLGTAVFCLLFSEHLQKSFYKTKFTIYYKDYKCSPVSYEEFSTRATTAANAMSRFYKVTGLKYEPYKVIDEFGTLYDNDGKISKKNYNK